MDELLIEKYKEVLERMEKNAEKVKKIRNSLSKIALYSKTKELSIKVLDEVYRDLSQKDELILFMESIIEKKEGEMVNVKSN